VNDRELPLVTENKLNITSDLEVIAARNAIEDYKARRVSEGRAAAERGDSTSTNPHPENSLSYVSWACGFTQYTYGRKKHAGGGGTAA
jgi:hypothetical protein